MSSGEYRMRRPPRLVFPSFAIRYSSFGIYLTVFAVALAVRAGLGTFQLLQAETPTALEFPDEQQYWQIARSLAEGQGLRDELGFRATRMPLYPAALSLVATLQHGVIVAKAVQWLVGSLAAVFAAGVAARLLDRRVALIAGLLVAVDPFLAFFSSLLLTETLFITLLTALWWVLCPILHGAAITESRVSARPPIRDPGYMYRWLLAGGLATLCLYTRETGLGLTLLVLGFVAVARGMNRARLAGALLAAGTLIVALLPWAARNRSVTGQWCFLTNRTGISLYDGVGPQATGASDLGDIKQMPAVQGMTEVEWNRYFMGESIKAMMDDPMRILRLAVVKWRRTWNPVPNAESYGSAGIRVVAASWTIPTFALAVAGAILLPMTHGRIGLVKVLFLLLPALYVTALHGLFVGSVRYRLVAIPFLEVLAALAVVAMIDKIRGRPIIGRTPM